MTYEKNDRIRLTEQIMDIPEGATGTVYEDTGWVINVVLDNLPDGLFRLYPEELEKIDE